MANREELHACYNVEMELIPAPPRPNRVRESDLDGPANPSKVNRQLRELFREAFDQLGGAEFLVEFALRNDQNARVFVQAISKLLPASATPIGKEKVIIDIPWLTRDRLAYRDMENLPQDADVVQLMPRADGADRD